MTMTMWLFFAFITKHFICDYPLQAYPYMYKNKGTYGHPGGLMHAGVHFIGTGTALAFVSEIFHQQAMPILHSGWIFLGILLFDFIAHYHIDWAKMNIGRIKNWKPDNSESFWILLGLDQYLHYLTYLLIIYWVT